AHARHPTAVAGSGHRPRAVRPAPPRTPAATRAWSHAASVGAVVARCARWRPLRDGGRSTRCHCRTRALRRTAQPHGRTGTGGGGGRAYGDSARMGGGSAWDRAPACRVTALPNGVAAASRRTRKKARRVSVHAFVTRRSTRARYTEVVCISYPRLCG